MNLAPRETLIGQAIAALSESGVLGFTRALDTARRLLQRLLRSDPATRGKWSGCEEWMPQR